MTIKMVTDLDAQKNTIADTTDNDAMMAHSTLRVAFGPIKSSTFLHFRERSPLH
jgi:hypothetical protein